MKKTVYVFIFLLFAYTSYAQNFYYSDNKKIYLNEDRNYILVVPNTEINSYFTNVVQPVYGSYFNNYQIQTDFGVIKLQLKNTSLGAAAIDALKNNSQTRFVWYAMYMGSLMPIIPTNEILYKSKNGITPSFATTIAAPNNIIDTFYKIATGINNEQIFDLANQFYESGNSYWCHPNFWTPIEKYTNDPLFTSQYYLKNTGQNGGVAGMDINVEGAWAMTQGNSNIKVAVIDQGVEEHEDMTGRVLAGYTPRDPNGNGKPVGGGSAHGQACAGIVAATKDNNIGISGIAPLVKIVPVNIFYGGETQNDLAAAINWAWNQGQADVLSNSWGFGDPSAYFDVIANAIQNARINGRGGKGSIVVFASGNAYDRTARFPGNVNGVISVGGVDKSGTLWNYSCGGASLDLVTPTGDVNNWGDVAATDRMGNNGYTSGNYTNTFGGTSAACPQVAGVAALILSANSALNENEVANILRNTATDMGASGFDNDFGYGRLNACKAVSKAIESNLSISGVPSFCTPSETFTINAPVGTTITWSVNPSGIVSLSPSGNSVTLTKIINGIVTLSATIANSCGQVPTPITKNIIVGTGAFYFPIESIVFDPNSPGSSTNNLTFRAKVKKVPAATSYKWYINNVLKLTTTDTIGYPLTLPSCGTTNHTFKVEAITPCGTMTVTGPTLKRSCTGGNPPGQRPVAVINNDKIFLKGKLSNTAINIGVNIQDVKAIKVIDNLGRVYRSQKISADTRPITINVNNIPSGVYVLQIFDGLKWNSKQVFIGK
ncbi:S8 family peptidase [Ferruginibacter sp. SUN002]|uniref:S8 family peptidase n=1 Tax=Ferruginibacter sp. SUN002 TaxID=2937789 RepID=UPI003D35A0B1